MDPPSASVNYPEGETFTERFDGYTLGYVTGQSGLLIDQVQFFWYKAVLTR
jgi:hypothetical protein